MRTISMTPPTDSALLSQRCACCDSDPTHTPAEIARAARAHQRADQQMWEALQSQLPAMREAWALADAQADPRLWCPPEWVAEEEARRRAERRARRVERVPAQRPAPEPEPLRGPPVEVLAAFGIPVPICAPEPEPEAQEVDLDDEPTQADEGPSAVLENARVRDGRTAQEVLHDADEAHLRKHKTPRWRRTTKTAPEAPWRVDRYALPEPVQHLVDTDYGAGRRQLYSAAMRVTMSALRAGWTDGQVVDFLRRPEVPLSVLCTHAEPRRSDSGPGRARSTEDARRRAADLVRIAQQQISTGAPDAPARSEPPILREVRQVLLEHDWRGPSGRSELAVLQHLLTRATAVRRSTLHASARETALSIGVGRMTAHRALQRLQHLNGL